MRDAIGFGLGNRANELLTGAKLQVAFVPQLDTHRGVKRVRLRIRDLFVPGVPAAQPLKVAANQSRG